MFNLLPPLDVIDPESFMAETISILLGYPDEVVARTVHEIPRRTDRPTLRLIKSVCDELVEPIDRELQRRRASESHRAELPRPKRTPEQQARIDAEVASARKQLGIPEGAKDKSAIWASRGNEVLTGFDLNQLGNKQAEGDADGDGSERQSGIGA